jgi:hypothetical protein
MEKKNNGFLKAILIVSGALVSLAGAIAIFYTVVKKRLKFTIELCPEDHEICDCEGEECICGCVNEVEEEAEDADEIEIELEDDGVIEEDAE